MGKVRKTRTVCTRRYNPTGVPAVKLAVSDIDKGAPIMNRVIRYNSVNSEFVRYTYCNVSASSSIVQFLYHFLLHSIVV